MFDIDTFNTKLSTLNVTNSIDFIHYLNDSRRHFYDYEKYERTVDSIASAMTDFVYFRILERRATSMYDSRRAYDAIKLHQDQLVSVVNETLPWYRILKNAVFS